MKTDYVLVDFENVQPKNMGLLHGGPYKIKIFVGANQAKIPLELARALQALGPNAEYMQIDGTGANALDFHIAYYLGRLASDNPGANFHLISKDRGFDPLIKHLNAQKISCRRSSSISDIFLAKAPKSAPTLERVDVSAAAGCPRRSAARRPLNAIVGKRGPDIALLLRAF